MIVDSSAKAEPDGDTVYYYHTDHLDTPVKMTDEGGNDVWRATFSPFMDSYQQSGNVTQPLRFQDEKFSFSNLIDEYAYNKCKKILK